jgi:hypothetical protein
MHTVLHCQRADPRFVFAYADADALSLWEHVRPLDGLADLVLWVATRSRSLPSSARRGSATPSTSSTGG